MLQYSSTHTVSCYSTFQRTLYRVTVQFNTHCIMLQYSSTHTVSCYSTVQNTLYHVTVQFNKHCIMLQYSWTHTVSCYSTVQHKLYHVTVQFNTHYIMLQYSWTHTVSCYSTVQNTLYHLSVYTVPFPTLYIPICFVPLYHQIVCSLHLLCVSVCIIFVVWYLFCNVWSFAIISLKVSPSRSPLTTHSNMSSSPIGCLSPLPMYWLCSNLPLLVFFMVGPNFAFTCWMPSFKKLLSIDWFNSTANFAATLTVHFIFDWLFL